MSKAEREVSIEIDETLCKRCGLCVAFCRGEVYREDKDGLPLVENLPGCTGCRQCELRCPDFAIKVEVISHE